ncbi:hypothetical protein MC885_003865 [Smutsia gigantea]|nr:hypothetical protein MC885_003865 [Smutsia gigantea]
MSTTFLQTSSSTLGGGFTQMGSLLAGGGSFGGDSLSGGGGSRSILASSARVVSLGSGGGYGGSMSCTFGGGAVSGSSAGFRGGLGAQATTVRVSPWQTRNAGVASQVQMLGTSAGVARAWEPWESGQYQ